MIRRLFASAGALLSRDVVIVTNAIAFQVLLCLFPLLLVLVAAAQHLPQSSRFTAALALVLREMIPFHHDELARSITDLGKISRKVQIVSLLLIMWGSSGIFMPVEMALGRAWGGKPRAFVSSRVLAFLMTVATGLLAFLSVGLTLAARTYAREWPLVTGTAAKASALLLTVLLFFLVYRLIPQPAVGNAVALRAALWAGVAWEGAKYLFVRNLAAANLKAFYGPVAYAVALVLWAYVSSLVLVFGALMSPNTGGRSRSR